MKQSNAGLDMPSEAGEVTMAQLIEFERLKVFQTVLEMICAASMDAVCIIDRTCIFWPFFN